MDLPVMPPLKPMLAKATREVPLGDYLYEPKWDGFRCLVFRDGGEVELASRNSKPLTRYFPELIGPIIEQLPPRCALDAELVVPTPDGLDFDLLGQRIHPAESRVTKLSGETPAHLVIFDILALDDLDVRPLPLAQRRSSLVDLLGDVLAPLHLTPASEDFDLACEWFARFDGGGFDGVMAKRLDGPYEENKRAQVKVKHHRSVDCVVAGYAEHRNGGVGSLKLGLFDEGSGEEPPRLHHVGVCSAFSEAMRRSLEGELAPLTEGAATNHPWRPPGPEDSGSAESEVAGTRGPGAPNRWSSGRGTAPWIPLRPERVVEVTCENISNGRFRHPARFIDWRPDLEPQGCSMSQLDSEVPEELTELFKL